VIPPRAARLACAVAAILALSAAAVLLAEQVAQDPPGIMAPALASADVSAKFDDGFYDQIQGWIGAGGASGATGSSGAPTARNVMIVVGRTSDDGRDPDTVARENKDTVVRVLDEIGAKDIVKAKSLSFVTATVPLTRLAELAAYGSVHRIGDGEEPMSLAVNEARVTINAEAADLRLPSGVTLSGSGVNVAILDTGIENPALNPIVTKRQHCDSTGCRVQTLADRTHTVNGTAWPSHGTRVASVVATSGNDVRAGIAPGVRLFDVVVFPPPDSMGKTTTNVSAYANGLDWAHANGAHVANLSFASSGCTTDSASSLVVNEAVDKGMVVVGGAGNSGFNSTTSMIKYTTVGYPQCAHNSIAVGGVNDTGTPLSMYRDSSRGPALSGGLEANALLKPDLAAPAVDISVLATTSSLNTANRPGTSYAAPQVSAAAALLLEAKPSLTPAEVKAALLMGADWKGTGTCTASLYEASNAASACSHARRPATPATSNADVAMLNNVGLGILDVASSIGHVRATGRVMGDHLASVSDTKTYTFSVTDTSKPAKVVLTWLEHPRGSIARQANATASAAMANLNLSISHTTLATQSYTSSSARQPVEFAFFTPAAGKYTVTVSATSLGEAPTQPFALASTHALTATQSNTSPSVATRTVTVDPSAQSAVRLTGTDAQRDSISFAVSGAARGTVSTSERLSESVSRVVYTPDSTFGTGDSITVTPYDGQTSGTAQAVRLVPDSPPTGSTRPDPSKDDITNWREMSSVSARVDRGISFTPDTPSTPIRRVLLDAPGTDGAVLSFNVGSAKHKIAVPWGEKRQLELSSPTTLSRLSFTAEGAEEVGELWVMSVGYSAHAKPSICPTPGAASPVAHTLEHKRASGVRVPDGFGSLTSKIEVTHSGTATSVSAHVDISHGYRGDLKVDLFAPDGTKVGLHNRQGGRADHIDTTYSGTTTSSLVGKEISGEWRLEVTDALRGYQGTLNDWTLDLGYTATCSGTAPTTPAPVGPPPGTPDPTRCPSGASGASGSCPAPTTTTPLSDDFEGGLGKWAKSGQRGWTTSTSGAHGIPTAPGKSSTNNALHADACRYTCHVASRGFVDLSSAVSATLTFKRFVDSALDAGEYLRVMASRDGGLTWATLASWTGSSADSNRWVSESHDLASYLGSSLFKLRFATKQTLSSEDVQVDDVTVSVTARAPTMPAPVPPPPTRSPCDVSASSSTCLYYTRYAEQCLGTTKPSRCTTYSTLITGAGYSLPTMAPVPDPAPRPPTTPAPTSSFSIYVADTDDREVVTYSSSGTPTGTFVAARSGGLDKVWGIDFGPDGNLYVADHGKGAIRRYSGTTGAPMGTGSDASTDAEWARTASRPYGIAWGGNTLYVATYQGVERFSSTGAALGTFGDATRTSSVRNAALAYPHDIEVSDGRVYVADRHHNRIAYYSASAGAYQGEAKSGSGLDTRRPGGLASQGGHLWQAGDDPGYVNKLASPALSLVRKFTGSSIDEPYGVDVAPNGNVYVAMKDDDRVVVITPSGSVTQLTTSRLDDPRGVAVGPRYAPTSGSGGASGAAANSEPELEVLVGGKPAPPLIEIAVSPSPSTISLRATDADGDAVTFSLWTAAAEAPIALADHGNGTATLTVSASSPGEHPFEVSVSDAHGEEWAPHILRIVSAAPTPQTPPTG